MGAHSLDKRPVNGAALLVPVADAPPPDVFSVTDSAATIERHKRGMARVREFLGYAFVALLALGALAWWFVGGDLRDLFSALGL